MDNSDIEHTITMWEYHTHQAFPGVEDGTVDRKREPVCVTGRTHTS